MHCISNITMSEVECKMLNSVNDMLALELGAMPTSVIDSEVIDTTVSRASIEKLSQNNKDSRMSAS